VTDATFASEVLERSRDLPVIVDFWAPWCGPCRIIGPVLERLAEEYGDRVRLVKLNTDENPQVATQLRVTSIPHVMAFRDGKLARQFVGAVPEPQARAFVEALLPSPAEIEVTHGLAAQAVGDTVEARTHFEAALALDGGHEPAATALAAVLLEGGDIEGAARVLEPFAEYSRDTATRRLAGVVGLRHAAAGLNRAALEERVALDDDDARAHYELGIVLAAAEDWEQGLEHLLAAVWLDRTLDGDGPRRRLLEALDVLGADHPLSREFRARLANVLF
jgi:putative thioredoxin